MSNNLLIPTQFPVTCHTDFVGQGSTFVAIKGYKQDGISYIPLAIEKGARTIVVANSAIIPSALQQEITQKNISLIRVQNTRHALAILSAQAADYPADRLCIIGITGTKGKTTTSFLLEHIIKKAGHKTALLSTVHNKIGDTVFAAPLTTAQPDYLHQFLKLCVQEKVRYVIVEVAAQALSMHRVAGIFFDGIIFTNFSQEHGEFYSSLESYFQAKCAIFEHAKPNIPIFINQDDIWCKRLLERYPKLETFSITQESLWKAELLREAPHVTITMSNKTFALACPIDVPALLGAFNGYNIIAAAGMALKLGFSLQDIVHAGTTFSGVPGRMQRYQLQNGAACIIDYAHNPSSFEQLFIFLKKITPHLIVVFGAGGERGHDKRPIMGQLAALYADTIILTTDNPRSENPHDIINDIISGVPEEKKVNILIELDREQAIKKAYACSQNNSIIALLGKGPEEYQIVGNTKHYFSESEIVKQL